MGARDDIELEKKFAELSSNWSEEMITMTELIGIKQSLLPEEIINKWKQILSYIDEDIEKSDLHVKKSIIIRHKILLNDIRYNVKGDNGTGM